jgi:hypothetical protein
MIEIKQSKFDHPDDFGGVHPNGPANTFIRQDGGQWFVVTTAMPVAGVRAKVERLGFEEFVRVCCLPALG